MAVTYISQLRIHNIYIHIFIYLDFIIIIIANIEYLLCT